MKRTIALVTDFGLKSAYSGIMKGVIWSINPEANIVDLSHNVDFGDISEAFYILKESIDYFPVGTIFAAVVDPGVGSSRRIIAIDYSGKFILAPDNGLAGVLFHKIGNSDTRLYSITKKEYCLDNVSNTFHGRDIFAPVAAWISSGADLKNMGDVIDSASLKYFDLPEIRLLDDGSIEGEIARIDGFGNLITNITKEMLQSKNDFQSLTVVNAGIEINSISEFYAQGRDHEPMLLIGSSGYLEIAVNNSSAKDRLLVGKGSRVLLCRNVNR